MSKFKPFTNLSNNCLQKTTTLSNISCFIWTSTYPLSEAILFCQELAPSNSALIINLRLCLHRVRQNCADNLMTAKNISVVFGPTLMRDPDPNRDLLEMNFKNATIEFILNHIFVLFSRPSLEEELPRTSSSPVSVGVGHRRAASSDDRRRIIPPAMPPRAGGDYI
jgi:hypothetical protein